MRIIIELVEGQGWSQTGHILKYHLEQDKLLEDIPVEVIVARKPSSVIICKHGHTQPHIINDNKTYCIPGLMEVLKGL